MQTSSIQITAVSSNPMVFFALSSLNAMVTKSALEKGSSFWYNESSGTLFLERESWMSLLLYDNKLVAGPVELKHDMRSLSFIKLSVQDFNLRHSTRNNGVPIVTVDMTFNHVVE